MLFVRFEFLNCENVVIFEQLYSKEIEFKTVFVIYRLYNHCL